MGARPHPLDAQLTGPGGPFEVTTEDVLGESLTVFANRARNLREVLENSSAFDNLDYLVFDDGRRWTFGQTRADVAALAAGLADRYGVTKGDRVGILAANCPEWILTFWAAVVLGAVPVAFNGWWVADEIRFAIDDAEPVVLIGDAKRLARLDGVDPGVPVVTAESDVPALIAAFAGAALPDVAIGEDDPAAMLYTSGTTGRPKAVVNSHRNVIALSGVQVFHGLRTFVLNPPLPADQGGPPLPAQRAQLVGNPLFHVSGLYTHVVTFMITGVKTVWMTGRYDPVTSMQLIEREKVTGWSPHGPIAQRFLEHPEVGDHDYSTVVTLGFGGAPTAPEVVTALCKVFPNAAPNFGLGYGLTECAGLACMLFGDDLAEHPDAIGRPLPTVELKIADPDGNEVPDGAEGEIWLRGPMVMLEYWRRPEATAETIAPGRWLRTGDIGRVEDGLVFLNARARDLILRGAENVYPAEIELRLEAHPAVREAAVVGVDSAMYGQEVKAVVVCEAGADVEADELAAWVGERLAYFKVPAHWEFRTEGLPRTASGKVMKHVLAGADSGLVGDE